MVNRQTRILYQKKLFKYPLESFDALGKLGMIEAVRCVGSYAKEGLRSSSPRPSPPLSVGEREKTSESFEDWVCQRFGRRLFEIFFKNYSEKLWGISCKELDADFAAQRIKQFSLSAAIKAALLPGDRKKHRTLVDEFAYPTGGSGMVYERMAEAIRNRGGQVHLNTPVRKVLVEHGKVVGIELSPSRNKSNDAVPLSPRGTNGERAGERGFQNTNASSPRLSPPFHGGEGENAAPVRLACDQVISTMPLTTLVRQLDGVPPEIVKACGQLEFRNTILVYLEVLNENPFPDNWIYVHSPDLQFGRVTNFRNWVPQLYGDSPNAILALEYWCNANDEFWQRDEKVLIAQARDEIVKSGLVSDARKLGRSFVFKIPKCYPIYRRGYRDHLRLIKDYLSTISGLQVIGRYGSFKYNNQDHSILMGRLAAENVLSAKQNDLWTVNSDYDDYQEACSITETGLVAT